MGKSTKQEIIEGNELLAEFMEAKYNKTSGWEFPVFGGPYSHCGNKLKFDISWDWLMPVITKMQQVFKSDNVKSFAEAENLSYVAMYQSLVNIDIENTWKEIIVIIKWYRLKQRNNEID